MTAAGHSPATVHWHSPKRQFVLIVGLLVLAVNGIPARRILVMQSKFILLIYDVLNKVWYDTHQ
jgi:hypothetical protein